ncbi:MAG: serine/threonine-protein kinase [Bacteroidales bacterium]
MTDDWQRVSTLFEAALERPSDERERFVDEQAAGDERLRREVLSLIAAHGQAGSFLETPARDLDVAQTPRGGARGTLPDDPDVASLAVGQTLGPYRLERELGRGGMGVVYLAEDTRLARKVALKLLAPGAVRDEKRRERMRQEARAAARLSHPGIATVFALEEFDGELFIASEYVPGRTLRAYLDAGELPIERVVDIGVQAARALAAAHAEGVVHRDLKPENIMCGAQGAVKILDFGVARSLPLSGADAPRLTEAGTIVGTHAYMSPEQLESADVDFRSDIFSFGVVLYELATGIHPFEGSSTASTVARILTLDPRPPRELRRLLPPDFDRIVSKCLEKQPTARYQSTADLAVDLERLGKGRVGSEPAEPPVPQPPVPAPPREARWWRVHQWSVVCVMTAMCVVAWLGSEWATVEWARTVFFAGIGAAALNGTLRVHLLFTERHNRPAFRAELRRATPWLRLSDALFGVVLLGLALALARPRISLAVVLAAVGAAVIIVSVAVEPATTDAAFPRRSSGIRKKPPHS